MSAENTNEEFDGTSENPEKPAENAPNGAEKPAENVPGNAENTPEDAAEKPAEDGDVGRAEDPAEKTPDGAEDPAENSPDDAAEKPAEDAAEDPAEDAPGAAAGEPQADAPKAAEKTVESEAKGTVDELKEGWNEATKSGENKKLLAGLLAIFVGYFGVHKFILGYNKEGFILLGGFIIGVLTYCFLIGIFIIMAVGIVSLIEGILYLTKSDEEFYQTYQVGKKPWF